MKHNVKKLQLYLALNRLCGLKPEDVDYLSSYTGDLARLLKSPASVLSREGFSEQAILQLKKLDWDWVDKELLWAEKPKHHIITLADDDYPELLRSISGSPIVLFVYGDPCYLSHFQLAIVGSRNPTPAGQDIAYNFASYLANCGLTITSGLAVGIDAASHTGALQSGSTVAVMGTSIDQIYPLRHQVLAEQIAEKGAVISEFPLHTPAKRENFPRRNRIISGLSVGTLVVEAARRSGSLITARFAGEQGREVFAIPGSIHNPLARGCHKLIRSGAKLVETAQDILEELQICTNMCFNNVKKARKNGSNLSQDESECSSGQELLDEDSMKLLSSVGFEATTVDALVAHTGFSSNVISSMLLILELEGYVKQVPGGYCRIGVSI